MCGNCHGITGPSGPFEDRVFIGTSQNVGMMMNDDLFENWLLSLLAKEFIYNNVLKVTVLPSSVTLLIKKKKVVSLLEPRGH